MIKKKSEWTLRDRNELWNMGVSNEPLILKAFNNNNSSFFLNTDNNSLMGTITFVRRLKLQKMDQQITPPAKSKDQSQCNMILVSCLLLNVASIVCFISSPMLFSVKKEGNGDTWLFTHICKSSSSLPRYNSVIVAFVCNASFNAFAPSSPKLFSIVDQKEK